MGNDQFSRRDFLKKGIKLTGSAAAMAATGKALAAGSNSIVTENQNPGTAQATWDLSGQGQYSGFGLGTTGVTHYIEGFADNISVNRGTTINFKINTDSANYKIDIYRLGYYQGNGARLIATFPTITKASIQPTPVTNYPIGLVDCGNWSVSASWAVPSTVTAGVYIARLTRLDMSGANHIPFVVRDDGVAHDIIFQTSDTTWQAYNGWGGYNLYGGAGNSTSSTGRAYKVSLNRPYSTRDYIGTNAGPQDFVFGAEIAAIRWLEGNGYDVSYMTGLDMERQDQTGQGGQLIGRYKVYLSVGHDEYWSGTQRSNVEAARAAGVNLAFWSGNEIFWKTRWENSTDGSNTPYRTLVCYKETIDQIVLDPLDPPIWTGSWRDPSFSPPADGGRPENALSGTIFMVDSWRSDIIKIPAPMTQLRFWRNTSVAAVKSGSASLVQNLLGYEWDEAPDNGFQPAGLIRLSSTSLNVDTYLLDYGHVIGTYPGTHNLTLYRHTSGALVFGAGTVFWVWGLDTNHDLNDLYPTAIDKNVQQACINLFADMGVQPASLIVSPGIALATMSGDKLPPTSTITAPVAGSVKAQTPVTISGTSSDAGGGLVAGVEISTDNGLSWHPVTTTTADATGSIASWTYLWWAQSPGTYQLLSRAVDDSGNLESHGPGISVPVAVGTSISLFNPAAVSPWGQGNAPALVGPDNDHNALELGIQFQSSVAGTVTGLRFYKNPWNTGTHIGSLWNASGTKLASATFAGESAHGWQTVNISPVVISANTTYIASFHSTGGNYSDDQNYFANQRNCGSLKAPPAGGGGVYAYGSGSLFPNTNDGPINFWADLVFVPPSGNLPPVANNDSGFNTPPGAPLDIAAGALLANDTDPNGFALSVTGASALTGGTVVWNVTTQKVTFTPATGFTGTATFNYSISNGNGGTASATVSVTVAVVAPTTTLFAANSVPQVITENDRSAVELGMKFTVNTAGNATGVRFYKGPTNTGTHVGNLWSAAGALLTSVTFTNETASGWQQALFPNGGVALTTGTTYIISYHTNVGLYSDDPNYFAAAVTNGPITAPSDSASSGNGVYAYGGGSSFPSNSYQATNYWVDVVFAAGSGGGTLPPIANNDIGFATPLNTPLAITAASLLANDTDPNGGTGTLSVTGATSGTGGTAVWNATTQAVTFTPTTGFTGTATFSYTITNGHGSASATVSVTVTGGGTLPPIANNDSGFSTPLNTPIGITALSLLANDTDPNGGTGTLSVTGATSGTGGTAVWNATTQTVTFTPTTGFSGTGTFTYTITNGHGSASATVSVTVTSTAPPPTSTLFAANSVPAVIAVNDPAAVELGMKFQVSAAGSARGVRFYKGTQNTGTHTGTLWSSTGTKLATVTFTGETASGWQQALFASPMALTPGTIYVISYHTTVGFYSANSNFFTAAVTNGPISAPSTATAGGNGVYIYGASAFPKNTYQASNYWIDIVFG